MAQEWQPPTEEWKPSTPVWEPPKQQSTGILDRASSAWDTINKPMIRLGSDPTTRAATDQFSKDHPYIGPVANFAADTLSSMSSPLSVGLAGLGVGSAVASKAVPAIGKLARGAQELASAGAVAHGTSQVVGSDKTGAERVGGALEAGAGLLGYRHAAKASLEAQGKLPKVGPVELPVKQPLIETVFIDPNDSARSPKFAQYKDKGYIVDTIKPDGTIVMKSPDSMMHGPITDPSKKPITATMPAAKPTIGPIDATPEAEKLLTKSIRAAKPLRKAQETINSIERGRRIESATAIGKMTSGEAGFKAEKAALAGEYPKVQFESIREKLGQNNIDGLLDTIKNHPELNDFEKIRARDGLVKLFGEHGGNVPQANELTLLKKVFGQDLADAVAEKVPAWTKFKKTVQDVGNVPRSLMASFDLSAPFRQGAFMVGRKQFWTSFDDMFKAFGSEKSYKAVQDSIRANPSFELGQKSGLYLSDLIGDREEQFASDLAEKIPYIGRGVRASGRAYTAFVNKVRADTFNDLVQKADGLGLKATEGKNGLADKIATYINTATGRGQLGAFEGSAKNLNTIFFSPRLMASRLQLLNPLTYTKADPFVRKEALKDLFKFASAGASVAGLAKFGGAEVETDPRSTDWGKVKIGNTRASLYGGFEQYIRAASQLLSGQTVANEKVTNLGEDYGKQTRKDVVYRFLENKEAPIGSFITTLLNQKDFNGQPIELSKEVSDRLIPMLIQDVRDIAKDDPTLLPLAIPSALGVGVQTYESKAGRANPRIGAPRLRMPR